MKKSHLFLRIIASVTVALIFMPKAFAQRPPAPSEAAAKDDAAATSVGPKSYVRGLQLYKGDKNSYVRLTALIPKKCADEISLEYSCDSKENKIDFSFRALNRENFSCLTTNQDLCRNADAKDCVQLQDLAQKSPGKIHNRMDAGVAKAACKEVKLASAKFVVNWVEFDPRKQTDSGICEACQKEASSPVVKLKQSSHEIAQQAQAELPAPPTSLPPSVGAADPEVLQRHLERVKDRLLKKIDQAECQVGGDDGGSSDLNEIAGQLGSSAKSDPHGPGGRPPSGAPRGSADDRRPPRGQPTRGKSSELSTLFANNLDDLDDIQDAFDEKMAKCKKEAKRHVGNSGDRMNAGNQQMPGMTPQQNQPQMTMPSMMGNNMMSLMPSMMGMGGMSGMGNMGMLGAMGMGGMSLMNRMPWMGYGMNYGMMPGLGSIGMMGGMSHINMMGYGGLGFYSAPSLVQTYGGLGTTALGGGITGGLLGTTSTLGTTGLLGR